MKLFTRTLATAAAIFAVVALTAVPAAAADALLDRAKAEVTARIELRLKALSGYDATLSKAQRLTDDHEKTLDSLVEKDIAGLTELKVKVAAETTREAVRADAASMINDYRVFLLVGPQVRLTVAGDAQAAAIAKLREAHGKLAAAVADAKAKGADTAAAEQDLVEMDRAVTAAATAIDGKVAALLAVRPGPDAAAIRTTVGATRDALGAGRTQLRAAVAEAKAVRAFLKGVK
jgi:hypothetical protein